MTLTVTGQDGDKVLLVGDSRLGPLFGTFTYSAEATACELVTALQPCACQPRSARRAV